MTEGAESFIAECFWPGVNEAAVRELDARALQAASESTRAGEPVSYLGSLLVREDDVVLCQFEGRPDAVRKAAEQAGVPFERILATTRSSWPTSET